MKLIMEMMTETSHEEDDGELRMKRTKDYIKVPPVLYELLDIESLVEMGRQTACAIRNNKTPARLGAEQAEEAKINVRHLSMKEKDEYFTALGKTVGGHPTTPCRHSGRSIGRMPYLLTLSHLR